jgi:hypothetical protein
LGDIRRVATSDGNIVENTNGLEVICLVREVARIAAVIRFGQDLSHHDRRSEQQHANNESLQHDCTYLG